MNLADYTPPPAAPGCATCAFHGTLDATDRATLDDWIANIKTGGLRRSQVREAIHKSGGPLISETSFGRHIRNHT